MRSITAHLYKVVVALVEDKVVTVGRDRQGRWRVQYGDESLKEVGPDNSSVSKTFVLALLEGLKGKMVDGVSLKVNVDQIKDIEYEAKPILDNFYAITKNGDKVAIFRDEYNRLAGKFKKEPVAEKK